jgi:hypothetical protein
MQLAKFPLIFTILLSNCGTSAQELQSNSTIQEVFSTSEISDLNKILTFFESEICSDLTEVTDVNVCYANFFSTLRSAVEEGEFPIDINFDKQREMYNELNDSTFANIWTINKSLKYKSKDTLQSISYLYNGKFANLLERTGKDYPIIEGYSESFKEAGDITPSITANFIKNPSKLNLNDPSVKLIVAIHYLTLNDQYLRKEPY